MTIAAIPALAHDPSGAFSAKRIGCSRLRRVPGSGECRGLTRVGVRPGTCRQFASCAMVALHAEAGHDMLRASHAMTEPALRADRSESCSVLVAGDDAFPWASRAGELLNSLLSKMT